MIKFLRFALLHCVVDTLVVCGCIAAVLGFFWLLGTYWWSWVLLFLIVSLACAAEDYPKCKRIKEARRRLKEVQ